MKRVVYVENETCRQNRRDAAARSRIRRYRALLRAWSACVRTRYDLFTLTIPENLLTRLTDVTRI